MTAPPSPAAPPAIELDAASHMAQQAVQHYHWLMPQEMLVGLGFAATTPGPLISLVRTGIGTSACSGTFRDLQMTLLVAQYAQRHYLGTGRKSSMTETVKAFSAYHPQFFPLPHPSWRSLIWMRKHPWYEQTVIPELRTAVRKAIRGRVVGRR